MKKIMILMLILLVAMSTMVSAWELDLSKLTTGTQGVNNITYERGTTDVYAEVNTLLDSTGSGWYYQACGAQTGRIYPYTEATTGYFHAADCSSWIGLNYNFSTSAYVDFVINTTEPNVGQGSLVDVSLVKVNSSGSYVLDNRALTDSAASYDYEVNSNTLFEPGDRFIFAYDDSTGSQIYDAKNFVGIILVGTPSCVEDWVQSNSTCNGENYTTTYTDLNSCGTTTSLPVDNGTVTSCSLPSVATSSSSSGTRYLVDADGNIVGVVQNGQIVQQEVPKKQSPFLSVGGGSQFDLGAWLSDAWKTITGWFVR